MNVIQRLKYYLTRFASKILILRAATKNKSQKDKISSHAREPTDQIT